MNKDFEKVRPDMRPTNSVEESPRERAERRIRELDMHSERTSQLQNDDFSINSSIVPDGWTYEWKRKTIMNAEDPSHAIALAEDGWEPVPASRHPGMMPLGYTGNEILRGGMILMERPAEITRRFREAELREARLQVRVKEQQLSATPAGTFERSNKGNDMAVVKKGYSPIAIPE